MDRKNNFDLLRLLFALTVFYVHAYTLTNNPHLLFITDFLNSAVAVDAFFIISGYLIFMSYDKSKSLKDYMFKRIKRIYPAYVTVIIFCALLGFFISAQSADYFNRDTLKYISDNLLFLNFLHPSLPGVFLDNPIHAVNGALWTIKIEVMFYLLVPLLCFWMNRFNRLAVMILLYLLSFVWVFTCHFLAHKTGRGIYSELAIQLPGQLMFFIAGALFYYFNIFRKKDVYFLGIAIALFYCSKHYNLSLLFPLALATIVIYSGICFTYLGNFARFGDLSYGVYIFHFPILQLLIHFKVLSDKPLEFLFFATLIVLLSAFISWHLIEKRFLQRSFSPSISRKEFLYGIK